jgi:phosphatidylglycerol:prolipoprotein diacylglycerol transferase
MLPVLFNIGPFDLGGLHIPLIAISSYAAFLDLGLIVGLLLFYWQARRAGFDPNKLVDVLILAVVAGLVGARLVFVLVHLPDYLANWRLLLYGWQGGLSIYGGLLCAALAVALYARRQELDFWELADLSAPALALGGAVVCLGYLLSGYYYGAVTHSPLSLNLPDLGGLYAPRYPTQIIMMVCNLVLFAVLWAIRGRMPFTGFIFMVYLLFSSLARYALEFLLGEITYLGPFSYTQVLSLLTVALAVVLGYLLWARQREWVEEEEGEEEGADEAPSCLTSRNGGHDGASEAGDMAEAEPASEEESEEV